MSFATPSHSLNKGSIVQITLNESDISTVIPEIEKALASLFPSSEPSSLRKILLGQDSYPGNPPYSWATLKGYAAYRLYEAGIPLRAAQAAIEQLPLNKLSVYQLTTEYKIRQRFSVIADADLPIEVGECLHLLSLEVTPEEQRMLQMGLPPFRWMLTGDQLFVWSSLKNAVAKLPPVIRANLPSYFSKEELFLLGMEDPETYFSTPERLPSHLQVKALSPSEYYLENRLDQTVWASFVSEQKDLPRLMYAYMKNSPTYAIVPARLTFNKEGRRCLIMPEDRDGLEYHIPAFMQDSSWQDYDSIPSFVADKLTQYEEWAEAVLRPSYLQEIVSRLDWNKVPDEFTLYQAAAFLKTQGKVFPDNVAKIGLALLLSTGQDEFQSLDKVNLLMRQAQQRQAKQQQMREGLQASLAAWEARGEKTPDWVAGPLMFSTKGVTGWNA